MKKILIAAAVAVSMTSLAIAEVVFDLGAQQFYYPITKLKDSNGNYTIDQYREASYDTGKAIASTGLTSDNGYYRPAGSQSGYFGVQIKTPKAKSAVTFGMYCHLGSDGCSVQLLGENAQAINISFDAGSDNGLTGKISVDGNTQYGIGNGDDNINGSIEVNPSNITITINGQYKFTVDKTDFKLAKVNFSLNTDSYGLNFPNDIDKLSSLAISNSDQ